MNKWEIFKLFISWRLALFVPVLLSVFLLPIGHSFPYSDVFHYITLPDYFKNPILSYWFNFDGAHYLNIATQGYTTNARFYPLFPIVIFISSLGNFNLGFTGMLALLLPNIFFCLALIFFYKLLRIDCSPEITKKTIINLLVFPTSFFFAAVYSESLFLFLLLTSFYFARKKNWFITLICSTLLIITRPVGIFIIPAILYEIYISNKFKETREKFWGLAFVFIAPLGLLFYSFYNYIRWGSPTYFLTAHTELNNGRTDGMLILPFQTTYRYLKIFTAIPVTQFEFWIAFLEMTIFVFGILMLSFAIKKVRTSYLIFSVLAFLLPVFSGTFTGLPRYVLVLFPIFIVISLFKNEWFRRIYLLISSILLIILLGLFSRSYFIA